MLEDAWKGVALLIFSATYPDRPGTWLTLWQDMRYSYMLCCCDLMGSSDRQAHLCSRSSAVSSLLQGLDFEEDWKLLTILMGMNDVCDYCKDKVCLHHSLSLWWGPRSVPSLCLLSCSSPLQALFSVDNFIHYMTVSLEMLMNEVMKPPRARRIVLLGINVLAVVTAVSCPCFRSLVWSLMLSRSCPCRLWGRCRSPPQGACFRGEQVNL